MIALGLGRDIFKAVLLGIVSAVVGELASAAVNHLVPDEDEYQKVKRPRRKPRRKS